MATGWKSQNAWSDRRAMWQINEFCSRRTIESINAARQGRKPIESADIIAEDVIYAIRGYKREAFIAVCTRRFVEIVFESIYGDDGYLRIRVQNPDNTWHTESHRVTLDQYHFAQATIAEVEAILSQPKGAAKHSALGTQNSELRTEEAQS